MANELWTLSARALAEQIRSGAVSAVEAVEAHIARIEEVDKPVAAQPAASH